MDELIASLNDASESSKSSEALVAAATKYEAAIKQGIVSPELALDLDDTRLSPYNFLGQPEHLISKGITELIGALEAGTVHPASFNYHTDEHIDSLYDAGQNLSEDLTALLKECNSVQNNNKRLSQLFLSECRRSTPIISTMTQQIMNLTKSLHAKVNATEDDKMAAPTASQVAEEHNMAALTTSPVSSVAEERSMAESMASFVPPVAVEPNLAAPDEIMDHGKNMKKIWCKSFQSENEKTD